jgi:GTP:adenosylcobinamide-phosphate guanylyltransferase
MLRAVITAGGCVDGAFAAAIGTPEKALAPLGRGVLIDPVIAAIRGAGIADIAVVAGSAVEAYLAPAGVRLIAAAADGATNVRRGLDAWPTDDLLFATSDLPFVDAAAVRAFLAASAGYDLTMPLAGASQYEAAYRDAPAHVTNLAGERVANGSVFYLSAAGCSAVRDVAGSFFDARKDLWRMARLLGPALLLRFALGRLRIADIERRAQRVLGVRVAVIRDAAPALCYDVDTLDDYRYACART